MKSYGLRCLSFYIQGCPGISRKHCGGECHRGVSADTPRESIDNSIEGGGPISRRLLFRTPSSYPRRQRGHTLTIFPIAVLCKCAFLYPYATRRVAGLSNICVRIIAEVSMGTYGINKLQKTHKQKSAAAVSNG